MGGLLGAAVDEPVVIFKQLDLRYAVEQAGKGAAVIRGWPSQLAVRIWGISASRHYVRPCGRHLALSRGC